MTDCVFCKIINKEIPTEFIYEDDSILVFPDKNKDLPVHYLIIPKEHIQSIAHLQSNHQEIISKMIFTAKKLAEEKGLKGYKLSFNVGREGGQVVDHLHLHLVGGWNGEVGKADL